MAIKTIKAIQLSHKEQELKDIIWEIRKYTWMINSAKWRTSEKEKKKLERLIATKNKLENEITEAMLLD